MKVVLPWRLAQFVNERVASGQNTSPSDVVREALQWLDFRDQHIDQAIAKVTTKDVGSGPAHLSQSQGGSSTKDSL